MRAEEARLEENIQYVNTDNEAKDSCLLKTMVETEKHKEGKIISSVRGIWVYLVKRQSNTHPQMLRHQHSYTGRNNDAVDALQS